MTSTSCNVGPARGTALSSSPPSDPFFGHGETASLCARFVMHLLECSDLPLQPLTENPSINSNPPPLLTHFIAYVLHRTRLHSSVAFAALYLLNRLKANYPGASTFSGHGIFLAAFMIASKTMYDRKLSSKKWSIAAQNMFSLDEINEAERDMCHYLDWNLNIVPSALLEFEQKVRWYGSKDFGPYPAFVFSDPNFVSTDSATARGGSAPTSPPKPMVSLTPPYPLALPNNPSSHTNANIPDTPGSSMSTSPACIAFPATPCAYGDHTVRIVGSGQVGTPVNLDSASPAIGVHTLVPSSRDTVLLRSPTRTGGAGDDNWQHLC